MNDEKHLCHGACDGASSMIELYFPYEIWENFIIVRNIYIIKKDRDVNKKNVTNNKNMINKFTGTFSVELPKKLPWTQ